MNHFTNVYVTGSIAFDTIMDFPGQFKDYFHPEKLHQINVSFAVDNLEKQLGGNATNIAYNISLIFDGVNVIGSVGKDSDEFIKFFKKNDIKTTGTIIDKKLYTSSGSVITDKNDNQIWGFYYGAAAKKPEVDFKKFGKSDLFVISPNHSNYFLYFQKNVIKNKIHYLYDPGMALTWIKDVDLREGVINSTYLVANDYEIAMITKRLKITVKELTGCGLRIITTLGENGVEYRDVDQNIKVSTIKVVKMIDPTGAGDAWRGGFIGGLLLDKSIEDCLKLGNVMASFAIEKYGTVNHKPTKEEITSRLKNIK